MDTKARVDAVLSEAPYKPLHESVVRISLWDGRPLPLRRWAIENCVPAFQICGFFGEGGSGKSILEMMKDAAHVLGSNWLSLVPVPGPAIFLSSEDHIDELQVRLSRVADHYGVGLTQLEDRGFHLISRYGEDTLLCEATRSGRIMPTKLYTELREMIGDIKPKNVSLELSRIYAGSEIDRVSVNQLAEHLQALALLTDAGSVTLLGHPSLTGIASGTGSSGTTGWHGSFRARCYLRTPKQREDEEQDSSVRELVFLKNQYGALPATIQLRFRDGLWLPDEGETEEDREQRQAKVRDVFWAC